MLYSKKKAESSVLVEFALHKRQLVFCFSKKIVNKSQNKVNSQRNKNKKQQQSEQYSKSHTELQIQFTLMDQTATYLGTYSNGTTP